MIPVTYENRAYKSVTEFCRENNFDLIKVRGMLKRGYSVEEIVRRMTRKKYEYNGKTYANKTEIASDLGVSLRVYTQSKAFADIRNEVSPVKKKFTFRGTEYANKEDFYKHLGISGSGVRKYAIRHNITTAEALEEIANKRLGENE